MTLVIGIDMSMNSPAVCLSDDVFVYLTYNEKTCVSAKMHGVYIQGVFYDYKNANVRNQTERYNNITEKLTESWVDKIETPGIAVFEDYAYGASGVLTKIGENTGILKSKLSSYGWNIETVAVPTIKKFATGSGRASKEDMADAWNKERGFYVHDMLACDKKASPSSDVVDSYYARKTWLSQNS